MLGTAIVVLAGHAFVLGSAPTSRWMSTFLVVLWGVEGLLINVLVVELLRGSTSSDDSSNAFQRTRDACRPDRMRSKFLLESSDQSKERFRLMVESIRDYAIVMLDTAGRIVSWNAGAERILGYRASEIIGRNHAVFYPSEEVRRGAPRRALNDAKAEETCEVEGWRRRKDGTGLWAQVGMTPLRSGSGSMRAFAMVIRDITERKQAEEWLCQARDELEARVRERTAELAQANNALQAEVLERKQAQEVLRQQSVVLRSILDSIGDAIIVAEGPGRPLIFNPAARRFFGSTTEPVPIEQWPGSTISRTVNSVDSADSVAVRSLDLALRGEEVDDLELTVKPPGSNDERWLLANGRPLRDPSGASSGAVVVFRDITQRRRDAQELKEAKEAAEAASRAKDQFLAVLSHELRTPLTPVLLAVSDLVGNPDLDLDVRSTLTMIHRNVEVESRLIDDLLDLTRASTGRLTLDVVLVDAHRNIQLAAEVCRAALTESEIELLLELGATKHYVNADSARLQQVFWNLIQNAVKFTPRGGRITVRTRNEPELGGDDDDIRLIVEVTDTGIGIDLDRLPKIFTAFEQRDPVQRRRYGGLGLGLAISRSVVEAHGGRLTGFSAGKDTGAAFTIELAAQPGPTPASIASDAPLPPLQDSPTQPERLRILLIEDNPDTLRYVTLLLRKQCHEVSTAQDFRTASDLAKSAVFDLIISDIELPDGSGLEIIRQLHQVRPTPAIALSGFGSVDDVLRCRSAGFAEHLTKPIDIRELIAAIARAAPRPGAELSSVMPSCREPVAPSSIADKNIEVHADKFGPWLSRSHRQPGNRDVADQQANYDGCKKSGT